MPETPIEIGIAERAQGSAEAATASWEDQRARFDGTAADALAAADGVAAKREVGEELTRIQGEAARSAEVRRDQWWNEVASMAQAHKDRAELLRARATAKIAAAIADFEEVHGVAVEVLGKLDTAFLEDRAAASRRARSLSAKVGKVSPAQQAQINVALAQLESVIDAEVTSIRNDIVGGLQGIASSLERGAMALATEIGTALVKQFGPLLSKVYNEVFGSLFDSASAIDWEEIMGKAKLFAGWAAILIEIWIQMKKIHDWWLAKEAAKLAGKDWLRSDWEHQEAAWRSLYGAAGGGSRLPLFDCFFRFRRVQVFSGIGAYAGSPGATLPITNTQAFFHLLPHHVRELVRAVAARMNWPEMPKEKDGARIRAWRDGSSAFRYMRDSAGNFVFDPATGWPRIDPTSRLGQASARHKGAPHPEIPAQLFGQIPPAYVVFWLAPPGTDSAALLRTFEEERHKRSDLFAVGGRAPPPPGTGLVVAENGWGQIGRVDMIPLLLDWNEAGKIYATNGDRTPLSADGYRDVVKYVIENRGAERTAQQRQIDIDRRPLVREAIAWAAAIRAGSTRAIDEARRMTRDIARASQLEAVRLSLLALALHGPDGPLAVEGL